MTRCRTGGSQAGGELLKRSYRSVGSTGGGANECGIDGEIPGDHRRVNGSRTFEDVDPSTGQPFATVARLESRDTGKPLSRTRVDATVATRSFEFYANTIESFYGDIISVFEDKFGSWRQPESWA